MYRLPARLAVCLISTILLIHAPTTRAQVQAGEPVELAQTTDLKNMSLQQLAQIEVTTPSKEPEKASHTPAAIYVITGDDIRRSGASSIPEALRLAPGVEVARIDSDKWSIGIRGFGSRLTRDVLVLIDGRTVYTTLLAGTYWEVQNVMLEDVDRIEVIRGPGGAIWGPNAVDGVINIITKKSQDTHGTLVSAGGGNVDQGFMNVRYGGGSENLSYRGYGMAYSRGPEYHSDGQNFDDWRFVQGGFRIDWARSKKESFTFQGDLYDELAGERVVAVSYTKPYQQVIDANARLTGGNILARWDRTFRAGNQVEIQAYYDKANRREPNFEDLRDTFDVDYIHHFQVGERNRLSWGLGGRFSLGNDVEVVSGLTFQPPRRTDHLLTAFVQDEIAIVENKLSLTVGSKFLNTNFAGYEPEPSARLMWTPTRSSSFWAAATHVVRTPSDAEHDFFLSGLVTVLPSGEPFFARFNANRNFRPEQMNGYEVGYRQLIGKEFYVDVASFYNHYSDLFSEDITGSPFTEDTPAPTHLLLPAQFGNGLMGNTKGVEIAPEWRPRPWWRLRGTYSYLHMTLRKRPGSQDIGTAPIIQGSSPANEATAQSSFDIGAKFSLDLTYRFVSELPKKTIPSYSTADAHFSWQFAKQFGLELVGRNLLQPYHYEYMDDPGPLVGIKREGYIKLAWTR